MLLNLLVYVLILGLVFGVAYWAIGQVPMPAPFQMVAKGILALVILILLLSLLFGGMSPPVWVK